jgi:hypothetical protein
MSRFINRDEFKKYILRSIGAGVNVVEITDDQLDDRIEDAIGKFQRFHNDGSGKVVLVVPKTNHYQTEYEIPKEVESINTILHGRFSFVNSGGAGGGVSDEYLLYGRRTSSLNSNTNDGQVITPYYLQEQSYNTLIDTLTAEPQFNFSPVTNKLRLLSPINRRDYFNQTNALFLEAVAHYTEDSYPGIYDHEWVREYTEAIVGLQWGKNLTKFSRMAIPGQGQLNGEGILLMYQRMKDDLESILHDQGTVAAIYVR